MQKTVTKQLAAYNLFTFRLHLHTRRATSRQRVQDLCPTSKDGQTTLTNTALLVPGKPAPTPTDTSHATARPQHTLQTHPHVWTTRARCMRYSPTRLIGLHATRLRQFRIEAALVAERL